MDDLHAVGTLFNYSKLFLLALGVLSLWAISQGVQFLIVKLAEYFPSKRFYILQVKTLSSFAIYLGGSIVLFIVVIDPPKEVVFAAAGSMAVAVGFALKDISASLIAGVVLIFDTPFKTGDRISFDGTYGEIVAIGLRSVKIQTLDDNFVTIPNSRFISEIVASANHGALDMMVVATFHVNLASDIDQVKDIIKEVIVTSKYSYLRKEIVFTVNEVVLHDKLALKIDAKAYVMDVRYEMAFQSDIIQTANKIFIERGVQRV